LWLSQGSKRRASKILALKSSDSTTIDYTEYAIIELGGSIAGVSVQATVSGANLILQVQASDAASTNVTARIARIPLTAS
jgi:hypothetical protein